MLVSLSAPVSLSIANDPRVVAPPRGLLARDDAVEDVRCRLIERSEMVRRAIAMDDGLLLLLKRFGIAENGSSDCTASGGSLTPPSVADEYSCSGVSYFDDESSLESEISPAAMRAAFCRAASIHSCTRMSYSTRIRSEYSKIRRCRKTASTFDLARWKVSSHKRATPVSHRSSTSSMMRESGRQDGLEAGEEELPIGWPLYSALATGAGEPESDAGDQRCSRNLPLADATQHWQWGRVIFGVLYANIRQQPRLADRW
ncbi:hypothetical protein KC322_g83 [Hortaea werneckii]|nr:hypothetical protein KC322_g83 [Hortaea werneckii]